MDDLNRKQQLEAGWIFSSNVPWRELVTFGPSGFESYAKLNSWSIPSPPVSSTDFDMRFAGETAQLQLTLSELRSHTLTSEQFYFCYWEGSWGLTLAGPTVGVPERMYYLCRGRINERGEWRLTSADSRPMQQEALPALVWPSDRSWCIAFDVDSGFAVVGASAEAIEQLCALTQLSVERVERSGPPGE